ncbi:MAG: diguanylate cyclase, partial [Burkholderiales bacterium]
SLEGLVTDCLGWSASGPCMHSLKTVLEELQRGAPPEFSLSGEEFLLILPDADIQGAQFVVDRLRDVIARSPLIYDQHRIEVTFSCGIARLEEGENGHSLVLRADRALYDAKRAGRNCTRIAQ